MEASFPGSPGARRRFGVNVTELAPGSTSAVNGIEVASWEVDHPSGAPPLALRLGLGGTTIAYTGDTAWTENLTAAADNADLLIAEAYYYDKAIPHHLRYTDLVTHRASLTSHRTVLTHMSADMLARAGNGGRPSPSETAHDGLIVPRCRPAPQPTEAFCRRRHHPRRRTRGTAVGSAAPRRLSHRGRATAQVPCPALLSKLPARLRRVPPVTARTIGGWEMSGSARSAEPPSPPRVSTPGSAPPAAA